MILKLLQKKRFLFLAFFGFSFFLFAHTASAATRYWVGGCSTALWNCNDAGVTNWGSVSNTRDNASVPASSDDVIFDGIGFGASDSTMDSSPTIKTLDMSAYANTWTIGSSRTLTLNSAGALTFGSGMRIVKSNSGAGISFTSTTGTTTITTNGVVMPNLVINGNGGNFVFADGVTAATTTTTTITLTAGRLWVDGPNNNSGLTHTWGAFSSSGSGTRTLALGNSSTTITVVNSSPWNMGTPTNMTVLDNNATVTFTGAPSTYPTFGGLNMNGLSLVFAGSGVRGLTPGGSTFKNITRIGTASKTDTFTFNSTGSLIVTGTLTITGDSSINRLLVTNLTLGTPTTITANGTISVSNADFRDITGAGSASWDLSAITGLSGDAGGNSGITFTTAATQTWNDPAGGSWSDSTKWTSRVPLPQDDVAMSIGRDYDSGAVVTGDMARLGKNIDWSGVTWAGSAVRWTLTSGLNISMYGSLTLVSNMITLHSTGSFTFEGRSANTFTTNGVAFGPITISVYGGSLTMMDAYNGNISSSGAMSLTDGTFNANNFNITGGSFTSIGSATRSVIMGNGTWTLGAATTVWNITSTGLTIVPNSSTILITYSVFSTTNKPFVGAGFTYNNLTVSGGGSGATTISGSNTFNKLTINAPKTINFTSGTTQRLNRLVAVGTSGNTITLKAATASSIATLSMPGGNTFAGDYLSITDVNATGGAKWYAGANSTLSNSTGWLLEAGPQRRGSFIQDSKVRLEKGKMIIRAR